MKLKKTHIILIIVLALAIGVIVSTLSDVSSYATFEQAAAHPEQQFHIIGTLNKDKPVELTVNAETFFFTFYMFDNTQTEQKVLFNGEKPQDFEKSEQLVIIGQMEDTIFLAHHILLKCPSKYDEEGLDTYEEFSTPLTP